MEKTINDLEGKVSTFTWGDSLQSIDLQRSLFDSSHETNCEIAPIDGSGGPITNELKEIAEKVKIEITSLDSKRYFIEFNSFVEVITLQSKESLDKEILLKCRVALVT